MIALFTWISLGLSVWVSPPAEWSFAKEKNGIKVYTRLKEGQKLKELKAVATYNCTKNALYTTFIDIQHMNDWYDMVEKVVLLKQISATEGVYKIFFDFPSLAGDRYSTIKASIRKESNGDLRVESKFYAIEHIAEEDYVYVKNIESAWKISGKDGKLSVEHTAFMDPSGSIPNWIINATLTDGPINTLTNLKKKACQ